MSDSSEIHAAAPAHISSTHDVASNDDELERDDERRRARNVPPIDGDTPGAWVIDPTGDAPEPCEPA